MMDEFGQWMMVLTNITTSSVGLKKTWNNSIFFYNGWIQGNGTTFELYAMDKPQGILKMCNNLNNLDNGWK
jgi:hypothetical protein